MIKITNFDIKKECLLGWFFNDKYFRSFGMLTGVKHGGTYEENYNRLWKHFKPATKEEVLDRCYYK